MVQCIMESYTIFTVCDYDKSSLIVSWQIVSNKLEERRVIDLDIGIPIYIMSCVPLAGRLEDINLNVHFLFGHM